jgi:hypothetical protein
VAGQQIERALRGVLIDHRASIKQAQALLIRDGRRQLLKLAAGHCGALMGTAASLSRDRLANSLVPPTASRLDADSREIVTDLSASR